MALTDEKTLDALFPLPVSSEQPYAPVLSPGHSADSAKALVQTLKENHRRFHIFFNNRGFHNHATHHLYAIYTLGAPGEVLHAALESHAVYQRPSFASPGEVTDANWTEHFEDEQYYQAYINFFAGKVLKEGLAPTIEKYVFDISANWVDGVETIKQPQMLNRLLSGVLHPYIHVGYGLEFNSPGMVVEGLSMACVTAGTDFDAILPKSFFAQESTSTLSTIISTLSLSGNANAPGGVSAFDIIARMLLDPELAQGSACTPPGKRQTRTNGAPSEDEAGLFPMQEVLRRKGDVIGRYASEWNLNMQSKEDFKTKIEEMFVAATLLYGVAGLQPGKEFKADFFLMHLVTSSLFLPSFASHIKTTSLSLLLHSYFASALTVWIARGRPSPKIEFFYSQTSPIFHAPGPTPTPGRDALAPGSAIAPNPWLHVTQSTLVHPNEHLPKAIRSLAHFAHLLGSKPPGSWADKDCKLEGAEKLDGTLFIRVASLTMDHLGWVREGEEKREWDFSGFWN